MEAIIVNKISLRDVRCEPCLIHLFYTNHGLRLSLSEVRTLLGAHVKPVEPRFVYQAIIDGTQQDTIPVSAILNIPRGLNHIVGQLQQEVQHAIPAADLEITRLIARDAVAPLQNRIDRIEQQMQKCMDCITDIERSLAQISARVEEHEDDYT